jgi:hypothetical protein
MEFDDIIGKVGSWTVEQVKEVSQIGKNILTQTLFDCRTLYPSRKLKDFWSKKYKYPLDKNGLYIKDKKKIAALQPDRRFVVHVGHHENHVAFWADKWKNTPIVACQINYDKNPKDFLDAITMHYVSCFASDESTYIRNALKFSQNNIHIIVYHKYRDTTKRDGNESTPRSDLFYIAAAATIRIAEISTTLLYLGTSVHDYYIQEDFYPKSNNDDKNKANNDETTGESATNEVSTINADEKENNKVKKDKDLAKFGGYGLGTFLISMCQYVSVCNNGYYHVIAQVANSMDGGAMYFYLQNYFIIIPSNHYYVNENKRIFGTSNFYSHNNLVYMVSLVPIFELHLCDESKKSATPGNINRLIKKGYKYFLKENSESKRPLMITEAESVYNTINKNNKIEDKSRNFNYSKEFTEEDLKQTEHSWNKKLLFLGPDILDRCISSFQAENIIERFNNNEEINGKMNLYKIFAIILLNDMHREYEIRAFVVYILRCINSLGGAVGNESIFAKENKTLSMFRQDFILTIDNYMSKFILDHTVDPKKGLMSTLRIDSKLKDTYGIQHAIEKYIGSLV